jgi:HPr kinase/phosphorylase
MTGAPSSGPLILHASCVALSGRGLLITGASGSGKSGLALELIARGARLVADDRVWLFAGRDGRLMARAPTALKGLIEARGMGLLRATVLRSAPVWGVVDLDRAETERLPPARWQTLLGHDVPLLRVAPGPHFAAALIQFVRHGRMAD